MSASCWLSKPEEILDTINEYNDSYYSVKCVFYCQQHMLCKL